MRRFLPVLLAGLLTGCGSSPPTRFYTLDAVPGARDAVRVAAPMQVQGVTLPAVLDRQAYVRQMDANRLDISDQDRWAAPLDGMIRRVLSEDLMARLAPGAVLAPGDPDRGATRGIDLAIIRFMAGADGEVVLECDFSFVQGSPAKTLATHHVLLTGRAANSSAEAGSAAMSRLLSQLADRIAAEV